MSDCGRSSSPAYTSPRSRRSTCNLSDNPAYVLVNVQASPSMSIANCNGPNINRLPILSHQQPRTYYMHNEPRNFHTNRNSKLETSKQKSRPPSSKVSCDRNTAALFCIKRCILLRMSAVGRSPFAYRSLSNQAIVFSPAFFGSSA